MSTPTPEQRFSDRVDNYIRHRPGHPDHEPMLAELRRLFDEHRAEHKVSFDYDARVHLGG